MSTGNVDKDKALLDLVEQIREELDEGHHDKADEDMEELRSRLNKQMNSR